MNKLASFLCAVTLLFGVVTIANATIITYTNQTTWETAVSIPVTLEDFNSYKADMLAPVDVGPFSISAIGPWASENGIEAYNPNPDDIQGLDRNIDGTTYYSGDVFEENDGVKTIVTISFDDPIFAFGWDYTSLESNTILSSNFFTITGDNIAIPAVWPPPDTAFFGIISDSAFTKILISGTDGAFGADNFRFASSEIPEPITMLLFGTGLIGLAGMSRRFNK